MDIKIITLNARGLRNKVKQNEIISMARFLGVNIILVQETHLRASEAKEFDRDFKTKSFWSYGSHNARGVGIIFLNTQGFRINKFEKDTEGRVLSVDIIMGEQATRIINIYGPNKQKESQEFFSEIMPYYFIGSYNFIVGGDFNCVIEPQRDMSSGRHKNAHGARELKTTVEALHLSDVWENKKKGDSGFTRLSTKGGSRIDRFYVSKEILKRTREILLIETIGISDHMGVMIRVNMDNNFHRQRPWKMNLKLLDDKEIKEQLINMLQQEAQDTNKTFEWWSNVKRKIKDFLRESGKRKAREKRQLIAQIQNHLRSFKNGGQGTITGLSEKAAETHLLLLREERWEAVRSMASRDRFELETWCSRRSLAKILCKAQPQMDTLLNKHGGEVSKQHELEQVSREYFADIFEKGVPPKKTFGAPFPDTEGIIITNREAFLAVKGMGKKKAPGPDGIPAEFYQQFWDILGPSLVQVLNNGLKSNTFPPEFSEGLVTLICKNTERARELTAWRPITLLNVDYKIASKIIANRIEGDLGKCVSAFQAANVAGRSIQEKLWELRDTIEWSSERGINGILLSVDQAKAFDLVLHNFIRKTLTENCFDKGLINAIGTLYNNAESRIIINGQLTESFKIKRGVRQGCPLSPLLYIIAFDKLLNQINRNPTIKGIELPTKKETKTIVAFADDLTVVVKDENAIQETIKEIAHYAKESGARINKEKTKLLYLGNLQPKQNYGFSVVQEIKILGITFNKQGVATRTWDLLEQEIKKTMTDFTQEKIPLMARAQIIKSVIIPKCNYAFAAACPQQKWLSRMEKLCFQFIWEGKTQWVAQKKLKMPVNMGGLQLPDFQQLVSAHAIRGIDRGLDSETAGSDLCKFWLGLNIRHFVKGKIDLTYPKSDKLPLAYKNGTELIKNIRKANEEAEVTGLKVAQIYRLSRDKEENEYESDIVPQAWERINSFWLDSRRKTLIWKIAHGVLPVKEKFYHWGKNSSWECAICRRPESIQHAVFNCRPAKYLWDCFKKYFRLTSLTYEEATGLHRAKVPKKQQRFYWLVATEITYQIWVNRCRVSHGGACWGKLMLRNRVSFYVKLWLGRELVRLGEEEFKKKWQCDGFKVEGGSIKFKLKDSRQEDGQQQQGNQVSRGGFNNFSQHRGRARAPQDQGAGVLLTCESNGASFRATPSC